jgi:release factor glutamine methyltransferase
VDRRVAHEPLQYLLGFEDFRGIRLRLTPDVLVPRPETEGLVDWALELMKPRARPLVADVGTGSGAIACAVAAGHPGAEVVAVDISPRALAVAAANAGALGLAARVRLACGDGLDPVRALGAAVDLLIANPPYLPSGIIRSLPCEVSRYEPLLALDGGADGMALSRRIIADSGRVLRPGGRILLEIGEDQAGPLASVMAEAGFVGIESRRDLRGVERYVGGRWEGEARSPAVASPRRQGDDRC